MFDIKTSIDFYKKLLADFADFQSDPSSARHAINAAISAYHMHEWVWGDWLKGDKATRDKLGISDFKSFISWIDSATPWFKEVQAITNGSKHFDRKVSDRTQGVGGFAPGVFDGNAFDVDRLEVKIISPDGKTTPMDAQILLEDMVIFWRDFLVAYRSYDPSADDVHLTEFK